MPNSLWIAAMFCSSFAQPPLPPGPEGHAASSAQQEPASAPASSVATGFLYKTLALDGENYAYFVYVPPEYNPDRPWPVILFLHGSGERGDDGFLQTDVGIGRAIRRHHRRIPAVVVMPQCRPNEAWVGPMAAMAVRCVEVASREYNLDADRIYLTGLSLGGHGAWLLAAEYPDRWAAVVPICGFAEYGQSTGLAEKIAPRLAGIPIWCFHGQADKNVPVEKTRELVAAIKAAGGKSIWYTEYPGAGHNVWDRAYDDPELWRWLFAQQRHSEEGHR
jgi:predicted peptidase